MKFRLPIQRWLPVVVVLALLGLWEFLARTEAISPLFFPPPSGTLKTLLDMIIKGKLWPNLTATLSRLALGVLIGGLPGYLLGLLMGWLPPLRQAIDPIIAALHPIPKIAIFPLILIIFGLGETSKIATIAIAAFFPMLINSMAGVRQINPIYFEVTRNYNASIWKTFTSVIIPGSLPLVLSGTRIAVNVALVITIAVELVSGERGLGVLTWFAWQTLRIQVLYATLITLAALGIAINALLHWLSEYLTPWYSDQADQRF